MNELFVNVKVDREERPDVDAIYMDAVQAMTGRGGWPMTVFLTPTGDPSSAAPTSRPVPRPGMPGFGQVMEAIGQAWADRRDDLVAQADKVIEALEQYAARSAVGSTPDRLVLDEAASNTLAAHDPVNGGFGSAPKFPMPFSLELLLRRYVATGDDEMLAAARRTLDRMAAGGIYDHLGGGFARYSTDDRWLVPHFEKMLYDNALLVPVYLHAWQLTGDDGYAQVVSETIEYVLRDLVLPGGGFASAEDADSEGVEGKFYVWTEPEVARVVDAADLTEAAAWYGVTTQGNFEGTTVLHRPVPADLVRSESVERARQAMFDTRLVRPRPGLDDKVLAEWNGLMIAALAEAGAAMERPSWITAAETAMDFLLANLRREDGRWYRNWQHEGSARHLGFAEDYVALIDALTRLGEASGAARWHELAVETADAMLGLFWDEEDGGLFTTGADADALLLRRREFTDGATASANGNAALVLQRVAAIHGRDDLAERARILLGLVGDDLAPNALAHGRFLAGLDFSGGDSGVGSGEIVIVGDRPDLLAEVHCRYLPNTVVVWGERFESPLWFERSAEAAYLCRDYVCGLPATTVESLVDQLESW